MNSNTIRALEYAKISERSLASGARPKTRPAWKRLARPGFPGFWPGLPGKCGLVKPGKYGHSQAFLATLATKAWPFWPCYFHGRAFSATLVKKPGFNLVETYM